MSDKFVTLSQVTQWFEDLDQALKDSIMNCTESVARDKQYHLYQASQLLRARMLGDFAEDMEYNSNRYD